MVRYSRAQVLWKTHLSNERSRLPQDFGSRNLFHRASAKLFQPRVGLGGPNSLHVVGRKRIEAVYENVHESSAVAGCQRECLGTKFFKAHGIQSSASDPTLQECPGLWPDSVLKTFIGWRSNVHFPSAPRLNAKIW